MLAIHELARGEFSYPALRSYATGRREHAVRGPMPEPVARIANRRLWLRTQIEWWLEPMPEAWRRNAAELARWKRDRAATVAAWTSGPSPASSSTTK